MDKEFSLIIVMEKNEEREADSFLRSLQITLRWLYITLFLSIF